MTGILNLVAVAGTAVLSVRLLVSGLYRRYWAFFTYLVFFALREGVASGLNSNQRLYYHFWIITEPAEWVLYALLVMELYGLVLHDYRGLATVGRWALIVAVVLALAGSAVSLAAPSQASSQGRLMTYYYVAERAVYFSLVIFLLSILAFLMHYPVALRRNIIVHSMVFSAYFISITIIYVVLSTRGFGSVLWRVVGYAMTGINLAALGVWLVMLNPAGELRKQRLRPAWMPGQEDVLVRQLNQFNDALLRATRK